jgi:5-formyltetrahydrofolate cyclo-ligase
LAADGAGAKRRLRSLLAERRRRVGPRDAAAAADAVAQAVVEEPRIRASERIALYAALEGEIPTRGLFEALRLRSHVLLLPRFRGDAIEWVRVEEWSALEAGRYGILEPTAGASEALTTRDVAVLPGLAFDRDGWRLGRGGGHYDRAFPPGAASPWLVGIGYSFQWLSEVPHDSRDRRVDAIVSENGWVWRVRGTH